MGQGGWDEGNAKEKVVANGVGLGLRPEEGFVRVKSSFSFKEPTTIPHELLFSQPGTNSLGKAKGETKLKTNRCNGK